MVVECSMLCNKPTMQWPLFSMLKLVPYHSKGIFSYKTHPCTINKIRRVQTGCWCGVETAGNCGLTSFTE